MNTRFTIEPGQWDDYKQLARHHYRARRPATVCQVWRLAADWPADRDPPLLWRLGGYPRLAGVVVVSYPVLQSAARNAATGGRYCTHPRGQGIALLNREVRTISRVIIHPQYRGLGLATRLVVEVLARIGAPRVEAFARMGRYVPFFRQAGMTEYPPGGGSSPTRRPRISRAATAARGCPHTRIGTAGGGCATSPGPTYYLWESRCL